MKKFLQKWSIAFKIVPVVILVVSLKYIFHSLGWEQLSLNPLFTSLVAGTIFLLGFLISGVLADYKESEKLPSEMASCFDIMYDESSAKDTKESKEFRNYLAELLKDIDEWFYEKQKTPEILQKISHMNTYFANMEKSFGSAVDRMKNEQNSLRRSIIRISTIRDTFFVASAYAIAEALTFFLICGLILVKVEPFFEAAFFASLVTFLVNYMLLLIVDLDNPFDYKKNGESGTEISLRPLNKVYERMTRQLPLSQYQK
ncbi:MAG: hypothetical protein ABIJ34_04730 [archaeon]